MPEINVEISDAAEKSLMSLSSQTNQDPAEVLNKALEVYGRVLAGLRVLKVVMPLAGVLFYLGGLAELGWTLWVSPPQSRLGEWKAFWRSVDCYLIGFGVIFIHCMLFGDRTPRGARRRGLLLAAAFVTLVGCVMMTLRCIPWGD
jgi:hypothetical protein